MVIAMATANQIRAFVEHAWPHVGASVMDSWDYFNDRYWNGKLRPVPIVLAPTLPFGKRVGQCSYGRSRSASLITLASPSDGNLLIADRGVLCHEMLHAWLKQCGVDGAHAGQPWRDEIVRMSAIEGRTIVAMPTQIRKDENRKSYRHTPEGSLAQAEIARWPHSIGLDMGKL